MYVTQNTVMRLSIHYIFFICSSPYSENNRLSTHYHNFKINFTKTKFHYHCGTRCITSRTN